MTDTGHKSRTARTFDLLRNAIIHAEFKPGQKLHIYQLGERYGASIGAVREALSRLTSEGLVVAVPQRGFIVAPISRKDLVDLTHVRMEIETRCLVESIKHGDIEWEGKVLSLQHQLRSLDGAWARAGTPEAARWHELHERFHAGLAAACQNEWWLRLREQLYLQSERYRRISGPVDGVGRDITAEHDEIAAAAITRDEARARKAMEVHLQRTTEILLRSAHPFSDSELVEEPERAGST